MSQALAKAIDIVGGQSQLARLLGVKQANIWHWLNRAERVPGEYVLGIEKATGGAITRRDLRPDLYPDVSAEDPGVAPADEDLYRQQFYALLARCLVRAPDTALLTALAQLKGDGSEMGHALDDLAAAAKSTSLERALDEFDALFVGLPRGELIPYASYYRTGFLYERPLAKLRHDMRRLGFEAAQGVIEPEDHVGAICEIMAMLIGGAEAGDDVPARAPASLAAQERFFRQHLAPWAEKFFSDLEVAPSAQLYKPLGRIGRLFIAIENQAFALAA